MFHSGIRQTRFKQKARLVPISLLVLYIVTFVSSFFSSQFLSVCLSVECLPRYGSISVVFCDTLFQLISTVPKVAVAQKQGGEGRCGVCRVKLTGLKLEYSSLYRYLVFCEVSTFCWVEAGEAKECLRGRGGRLHLCRFWIVLHSSSLLLFFGQVCLKNSLTMMPNDAWWIYD